jgi:hypothetical protein
MISEIQRKSLPAIAQSMGLPNAQSLHHFLQQAAWQVEDLRTRGLWLIKQLGVAEGVMLELVQWTDEMSSMSHNSNREKRASSRSAMLQVQAMWSPVARILPSLALLG